MPGGQGVGSVGEDEVWGTRWDGTFFVRWRMWSDWCTRERLLFLILAGRDWRSVRTSGELAMKGAKNNSHVPSWPVPFPFPFNLPLFSNRLFSYGLPQIARTSAIFSVAEIVVYRDAAQAQTTTSYKPRGKYRDPGGEDGGAGGKEEEDPSTFLARILEYLETPQ